MQTTRLSRKCSRCSNIEELDGIMRRLESHIKYVTNPYIRDEAERLHDISVDMYNDLTNSDCKCAFQLLVDYPL